MVNFLNVIHLKYDSFCRTTPMRLTQVKGMAETEKHEAIYSYMASIFTDKN